MALSVAAGLLGACLPGTGARIITLVGGPCTEGPGSVKSSYDMVFFLEYLGIRTHSNLYLIVNENRDLSVLLSYSLVWSMLL